MAIINPKIPGSYPFDGLCAAAVASKFVWALAFAGTDLYEHTYCLLHARREGEAIVIEAARMVNLLPRLKNLRVRRTWRGLYPMTPDGSPLIGWNREIKGLFHATGMCGQGLMLAPGVAELAARLVAGQTTADDEIILDEFSPYRKFEGEEALK